MRRAVLPALVLVAFVGPGASRVAAQEAGRPLLRRILMEPREHPLAFRWTPTPAAELRARRERLAAAVEEGAVVVVSREPSSAIGYHRYRTDDAFYYLTGVETDPAAIVMDVRGGEIASETLFLPAPSPTWERWNGRRVTAGPQAAELTGVKDTRSLRGRRFGTSWAPFREHLDALLEDGVTRFHLDHVFPNRRRNPEGLVMRGKRREEMIWDYVRDRAGGELSLGRLSRALGRLRKVKSAHELSLLQKAVDTTGEAHVTAMKNCRPGMWEFEVMGIIEGVFLQRGATGNAFASICGSGPNTCVLHYTRNRRQIREGELVLCDVGAAFGYYAADITRTFPAGGTFTQRQREVYEAVLAAQRAGEAEARPGGSLRHIQAAASREMKRRGFEPGRVFWHGVGHHVGLAVHDPGGRLEPGAVITIEPGIYLPDEGIGVRIEDMYHITSDGARRMSAGIPRDPDAVEALVGAADGR